MPWSIHVEDGELVAIAPTAAQFSIGEVLEATADTLRLCPDPSCGTAPDGEGGTYTVRDEEGAVAFEPVGADTCPERQQLLTAETWRRGALPRTTYDVPEPVPAQVVAEVDLGAQAQHLRTFAGSVWVTARLDTTVHRIDQATGAVVGVEVGSAEEFTWLAAGDGAVWVANAQVDRVHRVDPATNAEVATIAVGRDPTGMLPFDGSLWVSNHRGGTVTRIDVATNTVTDTIDVGPPGPAGPQTLVVHDGHILVAVPNTLELVRLHPDTGETSVAFSGRIFGEMVASASQLWIIEGGSSNWVTRVDDGAVDVRVFIGTDRWTRTLTATDDAVWACTVAADGVEDRTVEVVHIDPRSDTVIARYQVPGAGEGSCRLALGDDGDVWVTSDTGVTRIRPHGTGR